MAAQRLSWWCKRLEKSGEGDEKDRSSTSSISLVPAQVVRIGAPAHISAAASLAVLRLPCGVSIEFVDADALSAQWVASLLSALSRES
jgi:hypothetical protein